MATIHETIPVDRPAHEVFDAIADFTTTQHWDPGVARSVQVVGDTVEVGAAFDVDLDIPGLPVHPTFRYVIETHDRPHHVVLVTSTPLAAGRDDIRVVPRGADACTVEWSATFRLRGPGALLDPLLAVGFRRVGAKAVAGLASWLRDGGTARAA